MPKSGTPISDLWRIDRSLNKLLQVPIEPLTHKHGGRTRGGTAAGWSRWGASWNWSVMGTLTLQGPLERTGVPLQLMRKGIPGAGESMCGGKEAQKSLATARNKVCCLQIIVYLRSMIWAATRKPGEVRLWATITHPPRSLDCAVGSAPVWHASKKVGMNFGYLFIKITLITRWRMNWCWGNCEAKT